MGKVKIGSKQTDLGQALVKGLEEAVQAEQINSNIKETIKAHADAIMDRHAETFRKLAEVDKSCMCKPRQKLLDKRLRKYVRALRKESINSYVQTGSLDLVNKRIDLLSEKTSQHLNASKNSMIELDKDMSALSLQVDLIEQELKNKPEEIKEEPKVQTDKRLLILNIILIILNVILLCK